jgi:hypothetical protein
MEEAQAAMEAAENHNQTNPEPFCDLDGIASYVDKTKPLNEDKYRIENLDENFVKSIDLTKFADNI